MIRDCGSLFLLFLGVCFLLAFSLQSNPAVYSFDADNNNLTVIQEVAGSGNYELSYSPLQTHSGVIAMNGLRAKTIGRCLNHSKTFLLVLHFLTAALAALLFLRRIRSFFITQSLPLHLLLQTALPPRAGPVFA